MPATSPEPSDAALQPNKKRRAHDAFSRFNVNTNSGRGKDSGWTKCPLCPARSQKRFALGRGLSAHLHAVHTPWNPSASELRYRRRRRRRLHHQNQQPNNKEETTTNEPNDDNHDDCSTNDPPQKWSPTPEDVEKWNERVAEIMSQAETAASQPTASSSPPLSSQQSNERPRRDAIPTHIPPGNDRHNRRSPSTYRDGLPPLHRLAADGDVAALSNLLESPPPPATTRSLLESRDRHGSTAACWAAGNGHLECLRLLLSPTTTTTTAPRRRRDGKTPLHYAARNGRVSVVEHLLSHGYYDVDVASGDGTTPLHMACYGGRRDAIHVLMKNGADVRKTNAWGCGATHWIAMSVNDDDDEVLRICEDLRWGRFLKKDDSDESDTLDFHAMQRQGHTPLHKAAQRRRVGVIRWLATRAGLSDEERVMAGGRDKEGNKPSDIFVAVGGERDFADWMRREFDW